MSKHHYSIRDLRDAAGLTQKAFADAFGIPLSTLTKWEQGISSPPPYVITLLAGALPGTHAHLQKISCAIGTIYYDELKKTVFDSIGNEIKITEDLSEIKPENLPIYLEDLFNDFYEIQEKFNRDCRYDKTEDIIWTRSPS